SGTQRRRRPRNTVVHKLLVLGLGAWLLAAPPWSATVTLAWDDPTNAPGTVAYYNMYRQDQCLGSFVGIGSVAYPALIFVDSNVLTNNTYCWQVTAVGLTGLESGPSNTARLFLQAPAPPSNLRGTVGN